MGTDPQTPGTEKNIPQPAPGVQQKFQPPEGAISIARLKRVGITFGLLTLGYFTLWGSCHRQSPAPQRKKITAQISPMSSANIDSEQAELDREMAEAKRAAEQAEFAKRRAQSTLDGEGPQTAQANPVSQLRQQLQLEDIRRAHTAAYASTIAFAHEGGHAETKADSISPPLVDAPIHNPEEAAPAEKNQTTQQQNASASTDQYRLDEGTIIETVLLNRLDGEFSGPVITQVANDVHSRAGLELLIPKGSRLLGEAREVNGFDQRRLAVLFHRLILPNGTTISLDKFRGLDQIGQTGVISKVDHHYLEIFGTSLALGAIGGLAQIGGYGGYGYDPAAGFRVGFTERMGSSAEQVLAKFLNKYPTIKVLEGTRIKVILTNDLNLEAYQ